jgi:hypothetical protein
VSKPAPASLFSFAADTATAIDADAGVIRGVAVITAGPARGHMDWANGKPLFADATTLKQVMECANEFSGGLKVKFNHGSGVADIVGRLTGFRIDGEVLRADFTALSSSPHRAYLFEIASTIPESFGLSISFSGEPENGDKQSFARCAEIYSADFVDEPAANPNGLFQRGSAVAQSKPKSSLKMEDEKKDPVAEMMAALAALTARLEKLEATSAPAPEGEKKEEAMSEDMPEEKLNRIVEKAALAALKTYTAQFGAAPTKVSHEAKREDKTSKKFEAIVATKAIELNSKAKAIAWAVSNHTAEHRDYLNRAASGETITL